MTPRSIRRAAERKAAKQDRKAQPNFTQPVEAPAADTRLTPDTPALSPAKLAANRANAQSSCGPKTEAGKLISSHNALKTGLTGHTVILPTDDLAAYQALLDSAVREHNPATHEERALVQFIIDTTWRLERIVNLEFGIFALGSFEFADQFADLDPAPRAQMIQVETFLKYEKSIRNLNTQEARLQRRLIKDTAELQRLQAERRQHEADIQAAVIAAPNPPPKSDFGFDFSNSAALSEATVKNSSLNYSAAEQSALGNSAGCTTL